MCLRRFLGMMMMMMMIWRFSDSVIITSYAMVDLELYMFQLVFLCLYMVLILLFYLCRPGTVSLAYNQSYICSQLKKVRVFVKTLNYGSTI